MREYRRYYPSGEVAGHVVGFTTIDDQGQEGLELGFDQLLNGEDGAKRVIQDLYGRYVENVESIRAPRPGRDLVTSIDLRIQYLAYRELKSGDARLSARVPARSSSSTCETGEVLAMVNQPSYNPNDRDQLQAEPVPQPRRDRHLRAGLEHQAVHHRRGAGLRAVPRRQRRRHLAGILKVGIKVVRGRAQSRRRSTSRTVLAKSSNVGTAKVALSLKPEQIWNTLTGLGFGQVTGSDFPGESAGMLSHYSHWRPIGIATLSHGYGLSVTPLQLAHAYATIGAGGIKRPISFERVDGPGRPASASWTRGRAQLIVQLMEQVVAAGGTGTRASVMGYRVAGKTGTAWKSYDGRLLDRQVHGGVRRRGARLASADSPPWW